MITAAMCLALNIYFEASTEAIPGKWAVGQVVLNRVLDKRWPSDICSVVKEKKQFTWYWDGKSDVPNKKSKAWKDSVRVANALISRMQYDLYDFSGGANHYYNPNLATPHWRNAGELTAVIGNHVFRRL